MNPIYLLGAVVCLLVVIVAQQAIALSNIQRQVSDNDLQNRNEVNQLRNKLLKHISAEADDGK